MVEEGDGVMGDIPLRGFGTFQADAQYSPPGTVKQAVLLALETGYRHIDTAWAYGDGQVEKEVGEAIRVSGIPRDEIFIVTKLPNTFHYPEDVKGALEMSLLNMGLDYVDLYLMHNAYAYISDGQHRTVRRSDGTGKPSIDVAMSKRYPDTFKAMKQREAAGQTRMIGVSNFNILKLKRLINESGIVPAANQVEMNPYFPQSDLAMFCKSRGIQVIAHCPLGGALAPQVAGRNGNGPLHDPLVGQREPYFMEADTYNCSPQINYIAAIHRKTAAQVILAWIISEGICVVPKSSNVERIKENFDVCFPLAMAEQELIGTITTRVQPAQRNLVSAGHIGFDTFDEGNDLPM